MVPGGFRPLVSTVGGVHYRSTACAATATTNEEEAGCVQCGDE